MEQVNDAAKTETIEEMDTKCLVVPDYSQYTSFSDCYMTASNAGRDVSAVRGNFYCSKCNKYYETERKLKQHNLLHRSIRRFRCNECDKCFLVNSQLKRHVSIVHNSDRSHKCDKCDKVFKSSCHLVEHKRRHEGELSYKCEQCDKCFMWKSELKRHNLMHAKKSRREEAAKNFSVNKPKVQDLTANTDPYCLICEKSFETKRKYKIHMKIHTSEKRFQCLDCGKGFRQKGLLGKHVGIHEGLKKYQCNLCNKLFTENSSLTAHKLRQHEGIKNFLCEVCSKSFFKKSELLRHHLVHVKRFICKECGEYFFTDTDLTQHSFVHSGNMVAAMSSMIYKHHEEDLVKDDQCTTEALPFVEVSIKEEPTELNDKSVIQLHQEENSGSLSKVQPVSSNDANS